MGHLPHLHQCRREYSGIPSPLNLPRICKHSVHVGRVVLSWVDFRDETLPLVLQHTAARRVGDWRVRTRKPRDGGHQLMIEINI